MTATTTTTTATTLPIPEASAFPEALTRTPQWVGWTWGTRDGTRTKIPKNAHTGRNGHPVKSASTTDPSTWADFATAHACALRHGYGLGFMLTPPFVGVDLDHCRDAVTGELSTLGVTVLAALDTYAEVSISGTGIKAIAYGEKPGGRCRKNGLALEIYSKERLFALTGQRLDGFPLAINDCQDAINHIYTATFGQQPPAPAPHAPTIVTSDDDRTVIDWLSTYNPKFPALWAGDISAYNNDASAADQALCNLLAFRTGDEERVDRLFRQSRLYRPKWERADYRRPTIAKAMQQPRFFTPGPSPSTLEAPPPADHPVPAPGQGACPDQRDLQQENARLRAELAAERAHHAAVHRLLTAKGMTPVEKLAAYGLVFEVASAASQDKRSEADPEAVPVNCTAIAENVGLTTQTISANITRFAERGQLRKATTRKLARSGREYNEIAVCLPGDTVVANLRAAATWQRPAGAKHVGGAGRRCPKCAGTTTKQSVETKTVETTTLSCAGCDFVHTRTRRVIGTPRTAYRFQEAADVPTLVDRAAMRGRPTPSSVEPPPKTGATPAALLPTVGAGVDMPCAAAHKTVERPPFSSRYPPPRQAAPLPRWKPPWQRRANRHRSRAGPARTRATTVGRRATPRPALSRDASPAPVGPLGMPEAAWRSVAARAVPAWLPRVGARRGACAGRWSGRGPALRRRR